MTPREKLDALVDLFAPDIRSAFLAAIQDVVDTAILTDVITAIESGDPEAAFRALGFNDAAMRPITSALERAFEQGGILTGQTFPKYLNTASGRGVFRFDVRNARAEAYLRDHSSELITRITDDVRNTVRNTLEAGMQRGDNPRTVALDIVGRKPPGGNRIGGVVGLTTQQEGWVRSYRTKLETLDPAFARMELRRKGSDGLVNRAIASGKPLPAETIEKLVTHYKSNALRYRGESIGRTEALQALNRSEYEATLQAVDLGATRESAVQREWDSAGDSRVRFSHRALNGQRVGLREPFVSPTGARMLCPGDTSLGAGGDEVIMCRCRVRTIIDWFDIDDDEPAPAVVAKPKPKPVAPAVPLRVSDEENDRIAREYVIANGKRTGTEHLLLYDSNTGVALAPKQGSKSSVTFTSEMQASIRNPNNAMVIHHNHPSSTSLSFADMDIVANEIGARTMFAHGQNGSLYRAEKGELPLKKQNYTLVKNEVVRELQRAVNAGEITGEDATHLVAHFINSILHVKKRINYSHDLQGSSLEAATRNATYYNQLLQRYRK
jgi:hypothetical protein